MKEPLVEIQENNQLIAVRQPPGDNWKLVNSKTGTPSGEVIEGLVKTLTLFMRYNKFKGHYRLEPLNGKLYAITQEEITIPIPDPEIWDLYGEGDV
jgi:hypothetical protein